MEPDGKDCVFDVYKVHLQGQKAHNNRNVLLTPVHQLLLLQFKFTIELSVIIVVDCTGDCKGGGNKNVITMWYCEEDLFCPLSCSYTSDP